MRIHAIPELSYSKTVLSDDTVNKGDYFCHYQYRVNSYIFLRIAQYVVWNGRGQLTGFEDPYDSNRHAVCLPFIPVEINLCRTHE